MITRVPKSVFVITLLILVITIFDSCKKSADDSLASYTWTYGSSNFVANFKGAYLTSISANPNIYAGMGTTLYASGMGPRMTISSLNVNTYNFVVSPNSFIYIDDMGNVLGLLSGSVTITSNSNNRISGHFSVTLFNNVVVTGNFVNVPVSQ
jgi:hypothetical protein